MIVSLSSTFSDGNGMYRIGNLLHYRVFLSWSCCWVISHDFEAPSSSVVINMLNGIVGGYATIIRGLDGISQEDMSNDLKHQGLHLIQCFRLKVKNIISWNLVKVGIRLYAGVRGVSGLKI